MKQRKSPRTLAKLIAYMLGRHPDEFGLVTDPEGFVKIKDLLKVMHEEEGWKYVRRQDLNEILVSLTPPPIEIKANSIRATQQEFLPGKTLAQHPPKILYTCVRRRAYPAIVGTGALASAGAPLVLSADQALAEKIGRRIDHTPVLLTVRAQKAQGRGAVFYRFGELIYLTRSIPADCFSGPPLPKQKPEPVSKKPVEKAAPRHPGSYMVELDEDKMTRKHPDRRRRSKKISWKSKRKELKRQKDKMWPL